jgi:hypothetical protein
MKYKYLFKEFGVSQGEEDVNDWLERFASDGWEAVNMVAATRPVGGGITGGISLPTQIGFNYAVLMRRQVPL